MKRREFIKAGFVGGALFSSSGLLTLSYPPSAEAAVIPIDMSVEQVTFDLVNGATTTMWQFIDLAANPLGKLPVSYVVQEGDVLNINLTNNLSQPINLVVPGILSQSVAVAPGATEAYRVVARRAGSYYFTDSYTRGIGQAMGLYGPLIVMPPGSNDRLTSQGPRFDRQYTLVLSEIDTRLNEAIAAGLTYDMANYEPNYFFVNGFSYPQTKDDPSTLMEMVLGEEVAIRLINAGQIQYPMHFHGYHVNVISRNRMEETRIIEKDTVPVNVRECVDVILPVAQTGTYPLHTHYLPGVTANGVYANGGLLVMNATA